MEQTQSLGDKLAIGLSALCVIHCLAMPVLLIILPTLGAILADGHELFHQVILFFVLPVGLFALIAGYLHHHTRTVLISGCAGLGLLLLTALFGRDYLGETAEISLTVAASIMIAVAHTRNFQLRPRSSR